MRYRALLVIGLLFSVGCTDKPPSTGTPATPAAAVLPSWNDTGAKRAIVEFVGKVTKEGSADFVPVDQRIATFDNDGTLWSEQPLYFQFMFTIDRIKELAPQHPEWKRTEPFKSALAGDVKGALAGGSKSLSALIAATATGMTSDEYAKSVEAWITTARHPRSKKPYNEMIFQPMLELLDYLRAHSFKTFIVSGGEADFMRVWAQKTYGIPPEQVVGSRLKMKYQVVNGQPVMQRLPGLDFVDDGPGKPVGIQTSIGRRPVFAAGNSDGDFEMLEWTTSAPGPRFALIVHHTDAEREWAYDRGSPIGKLERGLDEAPKRGWLLVDMKQDWKVIYPGQ